MHGFGMQPLDGGYSGETFVAEADGERTVVRIYAQRGARRGIAAVETDAAVLRLVRGLLPVPEVLDMRRPDPGADEPGLLVTSFLPGERLDLLLPRLDQRGRTTVGQELGRTLGRLAQMPMRSSGQFVDGGLTIEPWKEGVDLLDFVSHQRDSSAIAEWSDDDYRRLQAVAERGQDVLDETERVCLVHSDFNPKNLLIDPETGALTGLLDWEFAHAGMPFADLGNLLRFDRDPDLVGGVVEGYLEVAGHLDGLDEPGGAGRLLERARAADLLALVELAGRRGQNPVADRADARLRAIATSGDLHAAAHG
jgi:aminoglycoside phosphotransferase (APT) family kinase protein